MLWHPRLSARLRVPLRALAAHGAPPLPQCLTMFWACDVAALWICVLNIRSLIHPILILSWGPQQLTLKQGLGYMVKERGEPGKERTAMRSITPILSGAPHSRAGQAGPCSTVASRSFPVGKRFGDLHVQYRLLPVPNPLTAGCREVTSQTSGLPRCRGCRCE